MNNCGKFLVLEKFFAPKKSTWRKFASDFTIWNRLDEKDVNCFLFINNQMLHKFLYSFHSRFWSESLCQYTDHYTRTETPISRHFSEHYEMWWNSMNTIWGAFHCMASNDNKMLTWSFTLELIFHAISNRQIIILGIIGIDLLLSWPTQYNNTEREWAHRCLQAKRERVRNMKQRRNLTNKPFSIQIYVGLQSDDGELETRGN